MVGLFEGLLRLTEDAGAYMDLMRLDDEIRIEFYLIDSGETATLVVGQEITVKEGSKNPDCRLTMEKKILDRILVGDADFGALIGRSKMSEVRPIDGEFLNKEKFPQIMQVIYTLMTVFFTPGKVKIKQLREELAGDAHGARPIPIVYWDGIRYAWYVIKEGEILNEAGEMDPYPQVIILLKGNGIATLGDEKFNIEPGKALYIPRNIVHQIEAREDIELIWLAWQTP